MPRKRLGELLLERRLIAPPQLDQALAYQRQTGHRLGAALVALGFLTEAQLCEALAQALGLKSVPMPPNPKELDWDALRALKSRFCEANDLFPLSLEDGPGGARKTLTVAMADPLNIPAIEEIEFTVGVKVVPVIAPLSGIRAAIRRHYFKDAGLPQDKMTVVRPGGVEEVIDDRRPPAAPTAPPIAPPAKAPLRPPPAPANSATPRTEEVELPVLTDNDLVEAPPAAGQEVTERTALAELIKRRAEKNRQKKTGAASGSGSGATEDLDYLFGLKSESTAEELAKLETRFWALLRIMAKKGLLSREEFLRELADKDD
ncbi:MAG: general secretion pathway protein GspE [Myxococcales bacterium]